MRMQKTITAIFLLFVTISMVAHSSIAHHHDGEISHAIVENTENHEHDHNCEHETQRAANCCTIENCLLSDFFRTVSYKFTKHNFGGFILSFSNYCLPKITNCLKIDFGETPYVPLFYSEFVAQSIGLRAPPAC